MLLMMDQEKCLVICLIISAQSNEVKINEGQAGVIKKVLLGRILNIKRYISDLMLGQLKPLKYLGSYYKYFESNFDKNQCT